MVICPKLMQGLDGSSRMILGLEKSELEGKNKEEFRARKRWTELEWNFMDMEVQTSHKGGGKPLISQGLESLKGYENHSQQTELTQKKIILFIHVSMLGRPSLLKEFGFVFELQR